MHRSRAARLAARQFPMTLTMSITLSIGAD
jgi:hypothetical protein